MAKDELAQQIDRLRLVMVEEAYSVLENLKRLDEALEQVDNQLADYAEGVFARHEHRRRTFINALVIEAARLQPPPQQPEPQPIEQGQPLDGPPLFLQRENGHGAAYVNGALP